MTPQHLVLRYGSFALVAGATNLAAQRLVLAAAEGGLVPSVSGPDQGYVPALLLGTLAGLVVKYVLDKRWIFFDPSTGIRGHGRTFSLYTLMSVVTTVIFWGTETAFWLAWQTDAMREAGAVTGLAIGYVMKYRLDRRYVFAPRPALAAAGAA